MVSQAGRQAGSCVAASFCMHSHICTLTPVRCTLPCSVCCPPPYLLHISLRNLCDIWCTHIALGLNCSATSPVLSPPLAAATVFTRAESSTSAQPNASSWQGAAVHLARRGWLACPLLDRWVPPVQLCSSMPLVQLCSSMPLARPGCPASQERKAAAPSCRTSKLHLPQHIHARLASSQHSGSAVKG